MTASGKEKLIENLIAAAAVGIVALIVAAVSLASTASVRAQEGEALASAFSASGARGLSEVADPAFERVYALSSGSDTLYATMISLRAPGSSARLGALFSPQGDVKQLCVIDAFADPQASDARAVAAAFPDASGALDRAAEAVRASARKGD
jgi:hypothetical protein